MSLLAAPCRCCRTIGTFLPSSSILPLHSLSRNHFSTSSSYHAPNAQAQSSSSKLPSRDWSRSGSGSSSGSKQRDRPPHSRSKNEEQQSGQSGQSGHGRHPSERRNDKPHSQRSTKQPRFGIRSTEPGKSQSGQLKFQLRDKKPFGAGQNSSFSPGPTGSLREPRKPTTSTLPSSREPSTSIPQSFPSPSPDLEGEELDWTSRKGSNRRQGDTTPRKSVLEEGFLQREGKGQPKKGKERSQEFSQKPTPSPKRSERPERQTKKVQEKKAEKEVYIPSTVTVGRLADIFGVKLFNLQRRMERVGMTEDQQRPDYLITTEDACNVALEFGLNPVIDDERSFDIYPEPDSVSTDPLPLRPPVVTIMGHVDHGKTTLLDSLRHTSVAAHEAGGITQHIGAFSVPLASLLPSSTSDSTITFLDTPGHAAFTAMRARGASVTDIVVLVVAADDGVMPQTKEVLELVKTEGDKVGLVVAINKCDKPTIDVDKVKSALGAEGILLEEDGGDVPSVRVSGLAKTGLDDLVETLSTVAEIRDLRARTDGKAEGIVLESRVDKGRGNVATVLVSKGTLHSGSVIVAGSTWARVRQMQDSQSRPLKLALPGTPVSITGWKDLPSAGDVLLEAQTEDEAKKAITNRLRAEERKKLMADVELINAKRREERIRIEKEAELEASGENEGKGKVNEDEQGEEKKELRLIIKGDVSGTVEAVVGALEGIGNKEAGVKIIHTGVGEVHESDIALAEATDATVIGFSVPCPRSLQTRASTLQVPLHLSSIIYNLISHVRSSVAALLPAEVKTKVEGEAVVQQIFEIKVKKERKVIAGCRVGNGIVEKKEGVKVRLLRGKDREVVHEGAIETLRHLKKDVLEVRKGTECGIGFVGFDDVKEGDEVVAFTTFEVPREL